MHTYKPCINTDKHISKFNYLREKTDADITISITKDGGVKFSNEIILKNRLSPPFKRCIEDWLRLVLVYDGTKRGLRNGEKTVFAELEAALNRKMLKVFSVFNYSELTYEVTENMTLLDMKALIETDTGIKAGDQMFTVDEKIIVCDDNFNEILQENPLKTLYVFNKAGSFEDRRVTLPLHVQELFLRLPEIRPDVLKTLFSHALTFIRREGELISQFDAALIVQIEHVLFMFAQLKQNHSKTRDNIIRLNTQIEHCNRFNERQRRHLSSAIKRNHLNYLADERKMLQQAKELTENFNSLTEKILNTSKIDTVTKHAGNLKMALASTETDMTSKYDRATTLFQKINTDTKSTTEIIKILNVVLEIPWKAIFINQDLKKYLRSALLMQRTLEKLLIWCDALNNQIVEISTTMQTSHIEKCIYLQTASLRSNQLVFPNNLEEDVISTDELIRDNRNFRCQIQDLSNQGSAYLRNVQMDMFYLLNGIIFPVSQNEECE
ncbi:IKK1 [Trypoxylus dichotomus]